MGLEPVALPQQRRCQLKQKPGPRCPRHPCASLHKSMDTVSRIVASCPCTSQRVMRRFLLCIPSMSRSLVAELRSACVCSVMYECKVSKNTQPSSKQAGANKGPVDQRSDAQPNPPSVSHAKLPPLGTWIKKTQAKHSRDAQIKKLSGHISSAR